MNKNIILQFALAGSIVSFFILGCSHTHTYVLNKKSKTSFISQLNKNATKNKGEIITQNQEKIKAKNIQVSNDTVFGEALEVPGMYEVALSDVQRITIKQPKSRANGFLYGTLAGFAIGGAIGLMSGNDPPEQFFRMSAGQKALGLGTVFGLGGGIIGVIFGAPGEQDTFILDETNIPAKYYLLKDVQILSETELTVQIKWQENTVWLDKAEITISKQDDRTDIRIPDEIYRQKFGK